MAVPTRYEAYDYRIGEAVLGDVLVIEGFCPGGTVTFPPGFTTLGATADGKSWAWKHVTGHVLPLPFVAYVCKPGDMPYANRPGYREEWKP